MGLKSPKLSKIGANRHRQYQSHIGPGIYTIGRENNSHQGGVMGSKWGKTNPRLEDVAISDVLPPIGSPTRCHC